MHLVGPVRLSIKETKVKVQKHLSKRVRLEMVSGFEPKNKHI